MTTVTLADLAKQLTHWEHEQVYASDMVDRAFAQEQARLVTMRMLMLRQIKTMEATIAGYRQQIADLTAQADAYLAGRKT